MASSYSTIGRFSFESVSLSGRTTVIPARRIPTPSTGQYYLHVHNNKVILEDSSIYQGGRFFEESHHEPTGATSFKLLAIMVVRLEKHTETPRYLVTRVGDALSIPGGYYRAKDVMLVRTAFRQLREDTTDPDTHTKHTWMNRGIMGVAGTLFAVIDSVPTPSTHDIICMYTIGFIPKDTETYESILAAMHPQEGKIDEILLLTLDELKARSTEFSPELAKIFPLLQEGCYELTWTKS